MRKYGNNKINTVRDKGGYYLETFFVKGQLVQKIFRRVLGIPLTSKAFNKKILDPLYQKGTTGPR